MSTSKPTERHSVLVLTEVPFKDMSTPLKPVDMLRVVARVDDGPAFSSTYPIILRGKEKELATAVVERWRQLPKPSPFLGRKIEVVS